MDGTLKYRIYLHSRCGDFANLEPINWSHIVEGAFYLSYFNSHTKFMVIPDWEYAAFEAFPLLLGPQQGWPEKSASECKHQPELRKTSNKREWENDFYQKSS